MYRSNSVNKEKKVIILKSNDDSFERYFSKQMIRSNIVVCSIYKSYSKVLKIIRKLHLKSIIPFKSYWYADWKRKLYDYDIIIIFDSIDDLDIVRYIERNSDANKIIFWYWNTVSDDKHPQKIKSQKCEFWSFDKDDCIKYNLQYNTQFYFDIDSNKVEKPVYDSLFVGMDKGRLKILLEIKSELDKHLLRNEFIIKKDKNYSSDDLNKHLTEKWTSYDELIILINKSKCLIDIPKDGQSGLTLRVLESLFFKKKLITNNSKIKELDFYNPQNIFIWGEDNVDNLTQFILSDYKEVKSEIIERYAYDKWISNFCNNILE